MTDSLKHLRELAEPEMLNKDTMLMPKAAADRWGWLPDKDTMLMPKAAADRWGWLPALSLTSAVGVFLLALAYNGGRDAAQWADPLFWFGLLVLFLPIRSEVRGVGIYG